jgi:hypothetical protein
MTQREGGRMALARASAATGIQEAGRKMKPGTGAQKSLEEERTGGGRERRGRSGKVESVGRRGL